MSKKLKYVINTVKNYKKACDILTNSLLNDGVDAKDIIYVYGNEKSNYFKCNRLNQIEIYLKYNLFEFTSLLGVAYLMAEDNSYQDYNYLFLHDTCKVLKNFKEKSLLMNDKLKDFDICWANKTGKHNIGIFTSNALIYSWENSIKKILKMRDKFNKTYAIKMEWSQVPESLHKLNLKHYYPNDLDGITLYPSYTKSNLYSEINRDIAYMTSLNLIKYYISLGPIHDSIGLRHPNSI